MRAVLAQLTNVLLSAPALLRILLQHLRELWRSRLSRLSRGRRWVVASLCAVLLLALAGGVLAFTYRPPAPPIAQLRSAPALPTLTSTTTATATARPTLAPTHAPVIVATAVPTTPPAPPIPTAPPVTPTVTFCPTATPVPPTPTAVPPTPTNTSAAATATPTSAAATATGTASPTGASAGATARPLGLLAATGTCMPCPYYAGNNPSQSAIRAALYAAADQYHLPRNLLLGVAWQESKWHEDAYSCDGGIGLMQLQYYTWPWLNSVSEPNCGLAATSYDPTTLSGNAGLGAKYLAYLSCFYSYDGGHGGTLSQPAQYTMAWYYQQAGRSFPDTADANSLCAAVFDNPNNAQYPDLPSTTAQTWSCPYSATAGDSTLLDITLSAYNEGPGTTDTCGICNPWYVASVETFIPEFFSGALPVPS